MTMGGIFWAPKPQKQNLKAVISVFYGARLWSKFWQKLLLLRLRWLGKCTNESSPKTFLDNMDEGDSLPVHQGIRVSLSLTKIFIWLHFQSIHVWEYKNHLKDTKVNVFWSTGKCRKYWWTKGSCINRGITGKSLSVRHHCSLSSGDVFDRSVGVAGGLGSAF